MSVLSNVNPTLLDLAKVTDPDGKIATIVEILNQENDILTDMTWQEGNLTDGNRTSLRSGIPEPTFRKLYGFVQPSKGTVVQVDDRCGMLEDFSEVDAALVNMAPNPAQFRLIEDAGHLEGFGQKVAKYLFYGNEKTENEAFTGLAPRYNSLSANNGENIISALGAGSDNASIWLCVWSPLTGFGITPKGSKAGFQQEDLGYQTSQNGSGGLMQVYRTHYRWDVGLAIRDWRYFVRIPNISKSALKVDRSSGADLPDLMYQALEQIPMLGKGRAVFYMSRKIRSMVRRQIAYGVKGSTLEMKDVGGKMIMDFDGVPMRRVDKLDADEAVVS